MILKLVPFYLPRRLTRRIRMGWAWCREGEHTFQQTDGANPRAALIQDSSGNLYSTTEFGGTQDAGTVFELSGTTLTSLYSFNSYPDGAWPATKLVRDSDGNLFGATPRGGAYCSRFFLNSHCGTVFKLSPDGVETVLHSFAGGTTDGATPGAIVRDSQGNIYGTTMRGGFYHGIIFKVDAAGNESILYEFKGGWDGSHPDPGSIVMSDSGTLYGTTQLGGGYPGACTGGCGTIWKLVNSNGDWKKVTLHRFKGSDGAYPSGRLIRDSSGSLYGTTQVGGGSTNCLRPRYNENGCGTVFQRRYTGELIVLNNFPFKGKGRFPYAGVVRDSLGNLYGTALAGGDSTGCFGGGCGTVFKIDPSGKKTALYIFTGGSDGATPFAELLLDEPTHTLYGTAYRGGDQTCSTQYGGGQGCGVVFKIKY